MPRVPISNASLFFFQQGKAFIERSGIGAIPKVLVNGHVIEGADLGPDKLEEAISMKVMKQTGNIQRAIMSGKLTDKENVQNWVLSQPDVLPRLNARLLDEPTNYLAVQDVFPCGSITPSKFASLSVPKKTQCIIEKAKYLTRNGKFFLENFLVYQQLDF